MLYTRLLLGIVLWYRPHSPLHGSRAREVTAADRELAAIEWMLANHPDGAYALRFR